MYQPVTNRKSLFVSIDLPSVGKLHTVTVVDLVCVPARVFVCVCFFLAPNFHKNFKGIENGKITMLNKKLNTSF